MSDNSVRATLGGDATPSLKKLAKQAGVKKVSSLIYDEAKVALKSFIENKLAQNYTPIHLP